MNFEFRNVSISYVVGNGQALGEYETILGIIIGLSFVAVSVLSWNARIRVHEDIEGGSSRVGSTAEWLE
jgi:hypothetical protein